MLMEMKKYNSIDLCKFIMALCVIAIHTRPLYYSTSEIANSLLDSVVSMAVPFFFLASGFLLAKKMNNPLCGEGNDVVIIKYLKRILKLYLLWEIIYFPWSVIHFHSLRMPIFQSLISYLQGLILVGELYNSWHLWYLLSTVYALLFILLEIKRKKSDFRILMTGCIILFISVGVSYIGSMNEVGNSGVLYYIKMLIANTIRSGRVLLGLFYIPVGMYLFKKKIDLKLSWMLFIVGFGANYLAADSRLSTLCVGVSAIGLFSVVESIEFADRPFFPFVRRMSTIIYFIHMYVWSVYYVLVYREQHYGMDSFIVTSVACLVIAAAYLWLKDIYTRAKR